VIEYSGIGDRIKPESAIRMGQNTHVARGLALRMDHGSQYLSDHFLNQIKYWGIRPSFGFVEEPGDITESCV